MYFVFFFCDVFACSWSFGVLLWEVFTLGSTPFPNTEITEIIRLIQSGVRNPKPVLASNEIYELMCNCWKAEPAERLSFTELVDLLELHINQTDPMMLTVGQEELLTKGRLLKDYKRMWQN
ncbi:unnamed protein product [Trichobilharzia regenti]|nr:unnamed protein product [Trichobilharzia regenti]